jgi:uncharacterized protein (TIGR03435 family)
MGGLGKPNPITLEKAEAAGVAPPDENGPSIFGALQEQLGLKLESRKGAVDTLVIDHAERPAAQ